MTLPFPPMPESFPPMPEPFPPMLQSFPPMLSLPPLLLHQYYKELTIQKYKQLSEQQQQKVVIEGYFTRTFVLLQNN